MFCRPMASATDAPACAPLPSPTPAYAAPTARPSGTLWIRMANTMSWARCTAALSDCAPQAPVWPKAAGGSTACSCGVKRSIASIKPMPSARPTPLRAAALVAPPVVPPNNARPASSEGSSKAKMAAANMMPAENDINAASCSLLTRCTRNTGKAPTAVATAASKEACTPAAMALPLSAAVHHARVGAQNVLSAARPAITSRPAPSASSALRRAWAGTCRSSSCNWAQTGRTWRIRVAMRFLRMV